MKSRRLPRFFALLLCAALAAALLPMALSLAGAPGDLDPEFGIGGRVKGPAGYANAVASGPDGSLYVTGCLGPCWTRAEGNTMVLLKYLSDGSLDQSFGEGGRVVVPTAKGRAILFQGSPQNKILVAGESGGRFTLFRFNINGTVDTTFDDDGMRQGPFGSASALTRDGEGRIIVAGTDVTINEGDFLVWRLLADGTPDTSFGGGAVSIDIAGTDNATAATAIGSKIYVGGFLGNPLIFDSHVSAIAALDSSGSLDLLFGAGGKVTGSSRRVESLTEHAGKLLAGGSVAQGASGPQEDSTWLGRFELNGLPDTNFATGGQFTGVVGSARALLNLGGGRVAAAVGRTATNEFVEGHNEGFTIAAFTSSGDSDPNFGQNGTVTTDFGAATDEAAALTVQTGTEKILAAGRSGHFGSFQIALARYEKNLTQSPADLQLAVSGVPETVIEGTSIRYAFRISNAGPKSAFRTILVNTIDPNVDFEGANTDIGPCERAEREVRCVLEGIAPGKSVEAFVQVQTQRPGEVTNRATVSTTSTDPAPGNNNLASRTVVVPADGRWDMGPDMAVARTEHAAILLSGPACEGQAAVRCGNVLVISKEGAEIYDPLTGTWRPAPPPPLSRREAFGATGLADGRVLMTGGYTDEPQIEYRSRADIFDPRTASWVEAKPMNRARAGHAAVVLKNGMVLATGGNGLNEATPCPGRPDMVLNHLSSSELYDPQANQWILSQPMQYRRSPAVGRHTLTLLPDGNVLAVGGFRGVEFDEDDPEDPCDDGGPLAPSELFDFQTGQWLSTGEMGVNRVAHSATRLANEKVLVVGGYSTSFTAGLATPTSELFDANEVAQNGSRGAWTPTTPIPLPGSRHTADLIAGRGVLITGGIGQRTYGASPDDNVVPFNRTLIYESVSAKWVSAGLLNVPRMDHTSTIFPSGPASLCGARCGRVLVTGGATSTMQTPVKSTEIYTVRPRITGISPPSGPLLGGTEVAISGTALAGATKVTFEGEPPLLCGEKSVAKCWIDDEAPDLKIHAISPPHAIPEKVHITVETEPGFVSLKTEADYFRYEGLITSPVDPNIPPVGQNELAAGQNPPPTIASGSGPAQAPDLSATRALAVPGTSVPEIAVPSTVLSQAHQAAQGAQLAQQAALGSQLAPQMQRQAQASAGQALSPSEDRKAAPQYRFTRLEAAEAAAGWTVGVGLLIAAMAVCFIRESKERSSLGRAAVAAGGAASGRRPPAI